MLTVSCLPKMMYTLSKRPPFAMPNAARLMVRGKIRGCAMAEDNWRPRRFVIKEHALTPVKDA